MSTRRMERTMIVTAGPSSVGVPVRLPANVQVATIVNTDINYGIECRVGSGPWEWVGKGAGKQFDTATANQGVYVRLTTDGGQVVRVAVAAEFGDGEVATPGANRGRRLAMLGDSITAYGGAAIAASATVDANNIATVTCTDHGLVASGFFTMHKATDAMYNGVFPGLSVIDVNTFTYPLAGTPSVTTMSGMEVNPSRGTTSQAWWGWMNAILGSPFDLVVNAATGGNTTGNMLARLDTDVLAFNPDFCTVLAGTNDLRYTQTVASRDAAFENIKEICSRLLASGCTPILCTVLPLRSDETGFATVTALMTVLNDNIRAYAARTPGVILADTFAALVDNSQTDSRAVSGALADTVHINAIGAKMVGDCVAEAVRPFAPMPVPLVASSGDQRATNASSRNRLTNPLFMTTGGQLQGVGGNANVGASWNVQSTGATVTPTLEPRTVAADGDAYGNNQKVVMAATALNQEVVIRTTQVINTFQAGDDVFADLALRLEDVSNMLYLSADFYLGHGGRTYHCYWNSGGSYGFPNAQMPFKGVVRFGPFKLPPGTQSTAVIAITIRFAGTGGATAYVGRARIANEIA